MAFGSSSNFFDRCLHLDSAAFLHPSQLLSLYVIEIPSMAAICFVHMYLSALYRLITALCSCWGALSSLSWFFLSTALVSAGQDPVRYHPSVKSLVEHLQVAWLHPPLYSLCGSWQVTVFSSIKLVFDTHGVTNICNYPMHAQGVEWLLCPSVSQLTQKWEHFERVRNTQCSFLQETTNEKVITCFTKQELYEELWKVRFSLSAQIVKQNHTSVSIFPTISRVRPYLDTIMRFIPIS